MSRRLMGIVTGVALGTAAVVGLWPAPVSADGCGQGCGTAWNQCIFQEWGDPFRACIDWDTGDCLDFQNNTCGEYD